MARALKTAAFVVGGIALVATGVGAAVGAGLLGSVATGAAAATFLGATAATFTAIGAIAGAVGGILSLAAAATAPKGTVGGNATKFKIDKEAGLPYAMGRTCSGGNVVHRQFYGLKNTLESWVTVHSLGPVKSLGPLLIERAPVSFSGGNAIGEYQNHMWLSEQLGACPEVTALSGPSGAIPGWGTSAKLSGLAADLWTLKFDPKGKVYQAGVPQRQRVIEGVYVYDPRLDSTYPGGEGPCRATHEDTYVWSERPALHALTWALGRVQNGTLVAGGGMGVTGIEVASFVEWANVCDANGWTLGGVVYTSSDNSWDVLKMIAQAGGAELMTVGGVLSVTFAAPRVSIGTISSADIAGDIDVPVSASRRARRNTLIAKVRLESHGWEMTPLDAVEIPDYVTADGGKRPKEIDFPLVQQADQGVQLGLYRLLDDRELDGIMLPCKVYALGYRPGDCLTLDIPEADLIDRDVVIRQRELDPSTMGVALTCRTETAGKHPFALGKTGTPPPTPDLSVPEKFPIEDSAALSTAIANSYPTTNPIMAADDGTVTIADHVRRYPDGFPDVAVTGATIATGLAAGAFVSIGYDDQPRAGGAVSYVTDANDLNVRVSPDHPYRHYLGYAYIPTAGSPPSGGGGATPPGGMCPTTDTPILMADRTTRPAGEIAVGDRVLTRHEVGFGWGVYPVEAVSIVDSDDVWQATVGGKLLRATGDHLVYTGTWVKMRDIGEKIAGTYQVVKITVTSAHTYVSNGILSHNLKNRDDEL